jgi:RimJ/RimL family protein N-acetyltransferase
MSKFTKLVLVGTKQKYKDQCYEIYTQGENYLGLGISGPMEKLEFLKRFDDLRYEPFFALINEEDSIIGFCGASLNSYNRYSNLSYMVDQKLQNKGFGKILVKQVLEQLKILNLADNIEAHTFSNTISEKLLISLGFTKIGTYPDWIKVFRDGRYQNLADNMYHFKLN